MSLKVSIDCRFCDDRVVCIEEWCNAGYELDLGLTTEFISRSERSHYGSSLRGEIQRPSRRVGAHWAASETRVRTGVRE